MQVLPLGDEHQSVEEGSPDGYHLFEVWAEPAPWFPDFLAYRLYLQQLSSNAEEHGTVVALGMFLGSQSIGKYEVTGK